MRLNDFGFSRWAALVLAGAVLFAAAIVTYAVLNPAALRDPERPTPAAEYVAMGDSYTSLPGVPQQLEVSTPKGCQQSSRNYPHLLARAIRPASFTDVSCAGAQTESITQKQWAGTGVMAPQQSALSDETKLVTLSIGGNDANILPLFYGCIGGGSRPSNCREKYARDGGNEVADSIEQVRPKLAGALDAVKQRAPGAEILVIGYPQVFPGDGTECPAVAPYTGEDLTFFDREMRRLNSLVAEVAGQRGARYVDIYPASRGRNFCAPPERRWVEPLIPKLPAVGTHPNAREQRAVAAILERAVASGR